MFIVIVTRIDDELKLKEMKNVTISYIIRSISNMFRMKGVTKHTKCVLIVFKEKG